MVQDVPDIASTFCLCRHALDKDALYSGFQTYTVHLESLIATDESSTAPSDRSLWRLVCGLTMIFRYRHSPRNPDHQRRSLHCVEIKYHQKCMRKRHYSVVLAHHVMWLETAVVMAPVHQNPCPPTPCTLSQASCSHFLLPTSQHT